MTQFIFYAHSGWRYVLILATALAAVTLAAGLLRGRVWGVWEQRIGQVLPIVYDIQQLLLGLELWILASGWQLPPLSAWEHPLTMLVAVGIVRIAWALVKSATADRAKFQTALLAVLVAGAAMGAGVRRITSS